MARKFSWKAGALTTLSLLLAAMFLMAGGMKLMGAQMHVDNFARWGYPSWFLYVTGLVEIVAAALIAYRPTRFFGGAILEVTMVGAVVTHVIAAEMMMTVVPGVLLVLSGIVTWAYRPRAGSAARFVTASQP